MAGETIHRNRLTTEEVVVPEGHEVCSSCKGLGYLSKYDMGWSSPVHSPELAAKRQCLFCNGQGFRPVQVRA